MQYEITYFCQIPESRGARFQQQNQINNHVHVRQRETNKLLTWISAMPYQISLKVKANKCFGSVPCINYIVLRIKVSTYIEIGIVLSQLFS